MEEIIEQLRLASADVPVKLNLPDDEELVVIEEQLLISLPPEYREFLLEVSDVIYGRLEPCTVTDPQSHTFLPDVAATAWDLGVPRELIPICEDDGQYYCVEEHGEVVFWRGGEIDTITWESIWHWARDIWLES